MRSINWIEDTGRSLQGAFPSLRAVNSQYMTTRLCRTLLERLPQDVGTTLLAMLPDSVGLSDLEYAALCEATKQAPELSIGYPDLIEIAMRSLIEPIELPQDAEFFAHVVDYFLWAFAQEFPPEIKDRISENLPIDLRSRMNLYSGHVEESKVA